MAEGADVCSCNVGGSFTSIKMVCTPGNIETSALHKEDGGAVSEMVLLGSFQETSTLKVDSGNWQRQLTLLASLLVI